MQKINYLCVDDEGLDTIQPILEGISSRVRDIKIVLTEPREFGELLTTIKSENPGGVILDLRLDQLANSAGVRADYRGLSVAQELRTRMTEGVIPAFPVVLWSVTTKLSKSYGGDTTAHDLFDMVYDKHDDVASEPKRVGLELAAVNEAYAGIGKPGNTRQVISKLLSLSETDVESLDPRFLSPPYDVKKMPTHELARYVLHRLVIPSGPLIDEPLLAARLGVDPGSDDWGKLKTIVAKQSAYKGIFSRGWPRWWDHKLRGWWEDLPRSPGRLIRTPAEERVQFLKERFKLLKLRPAAPIADGYGTAFWSICQVTRQPIEPVDGVRISSAQLPFHEPKYVSIEAALMRKHIAAGYQLDPLDASRFEKIKRHARQSNK